MQPIHFYRLRSCCITACSVALLLMLSAAPASAQQRLVAILVADTTSQDIKDDMTSNLYRLNASLRQNLPEAQLSVTILSKADYSRRKIFETITNAEVASGDALFFFYCGHGYYQPGVGSFFTPPADNGARLFFKDIQESLKAKNARMTVSILDSCSVIPGGVNSAPGPADPRRPDRPSPLFERLFFSSTGSFHINSSRPGEYAVCRSVAGNNGIANGSLFTSHLSGMLGNRNSEKNWSDIYRETKDAVDRDFRRFYREGVITLGDGSRITQRTQTVWALQDGQEVE